jgi:hypothetical protein
MEAPENEVKISLDAMSYSWGRKRQKSYLCLEGRAQREGVDCTFRLEVNRQGHRLEFPRAVTLREGEDLKALALGVKNALLDFLRESREVPEAHRQKLCDCVLNHHLQRRNSV